MYGKIALSCRVGREDLLDGTYAKEIEALLVERSTPVLRELFLTSSCASS